MEGSWKREPPATAGAEDVIEVTDRNSKQDQEEGSPSSPPPAFSHSPVGKAVREPAGKRRVVSSVPAQRHKAEFLFYLFIYLSEEQ